MSSILTGMSNTGEPNGSPSTEEENQEVHSQDHAQNESASKEEVEMMSNDNRATIPGSLAKKGRPTVVYTAARKRKRRTTTKKN